MGNKLTATSTLPILYVLDSRCLGSVNYFLIEEIRDKKK